MNIVLRADATSNSRNPGEKKTTNYLPLLPRARLAGIVIFGSPGAAVRDPALAAPGHEAAPRPRGAAAEADRRPPEAQASQQRLVEELVENVFEV